MTTGKRSSSQKTFDLETDSLAMMPGRGRAACEGNKDFYVLTDKDKIPQDTRNKLAAICARCPLMDCGWRQTSKATGYRLKVEREIAAMEVREAVGS